MSQVEAQGRKESALKSPRSGASPRVEANSSCRFGSSREELVLALIDDKEADDYQHKYGLDPRNAIDLAQLVLGG